MSAIISTLSVLFVLKTMQSGIFTTAAIDNIDHNPSTNSLNSASFHGTGISLFQHHDDETGTQLSSKPASFPEAVSVANAVRLPVWYTSVPPDSSRLKDQPPLCQPVVHALDKSVLGRGVEREFYWLHEYDSKRKPYCIRQNNKLDSIPLKKLNKFTMPEQYFSEQQLLPLFQEAAHSTTMMKHGLDVIRKAVLHVNPLQTPVVACDQPLYAIAKTNSVDIPRTVWF